MRSSHRPIVRRTALRNKLRARPREARTYRRREFRPSTWTPSSSCSANKLHTLSRERGSSTPPREILHPTQLLEAYRHPPRPQFQRREPWFRVAALEEGLQGA